MTKKCKIPRFLNICEFQTPPCPYQKKYWKAFCVHRMQNALIPFGRGKGVFVIHRYLKISVRVYWPSVCVCVCHCMYIWTNPSWSRGNTIYNVNYRQMTKHLQFTSMATSFESPVSTFLWYLIVVVPPISMASSSWQSFWESNIGAPCPSVK